MSRTFAGIHALDDVDLELHRHEVVGLIGPNGAGKSTLVNLITGFDTPDRGTVTLGDTDITGLAPHRLGRMGLARTFQQGHTFPRLSVRENVEVSALAVGAQTAEASQEAERLLSLLDLTSVADQPAGALPHGHLRRLGVARALATSPQFVLFDEPAAGLNESEVPDFAAVIRSLRDDHAVGVLLIDHNVTLIMSACDRVHVLDQGVMIAEGTPEEIARDPDVATAYLGTTHV
ncbi:MAG TPA: ABC transporter ATP-binding protein [Acidimicrobiia bacterium]|nr:ABC transporter ATP-binding protein [Acidimicrobiia bacterium]